MVNNEITGVRDGSDFDHYMEEPSNELLSILTTMEMLQEQPAQDVEQTNDDAGTDDIPQLLSESPSAIDNKVIKNALEEPKKKRNRMGRVFRQRARRNSLSQENMAQGISPINLQEIDERINRITASFIDEENVARSEKLVKKKKMKKTHTTADKNSEINSFTYCVDDYSQPTDVKVDEANQYPLDFVSDSKSYIESPNTLVSPMDSRHLTDDSLQMSSSCKSSIYKTPRSRPKKMTKNVQLEQMETPKKNRRTPIPLLDWADNEELWQNLVYKEEANAHLRNGKMFDDGRSTYLPRMRAILVDWIMEVCEVYHLRRNTYYLAIDYIDRFLTVTPKIPKTQLQLLGISCLFVAAKLEEIYPPKLSEFSYVCDGACTENEILTCEIVLYNKLEWNLNTLTPCGWLNLYMQIYALKDDCQKDPVELDVKNFVYPQYSGYEFVRASHVMDLFSMDPGYLRYNYSMIAAGAMYFIYGKEAVVTVTGFTLRELKPLVNYMAVFYHLINTSLDPRLACVLPEVEDRRLESTIRYIKKIVPRVIPDENHTIQTHLITLEYFENSMLLRVKLLGLHIEKGFIKKIKDESGQIQYLKSSEESTDTDDKITNIVMYDLTPTTDYVSIDLTQLLPPPIHPTDPEYEAGAVNLFKISEKTTVTFDDILSSIHNQYDNMIAIQVNLPLPSHTNYK